ncbi:MAG: insulinase family protein [candidate division KSB1 bacterium]|nr:insulinase family protein [candidate division KSB1 bacterium]
MKRILYLIVLFNAITQAQEINLRVPYTRFVLPNGLNVILHEDHSTPRVSVNVWYHAGSAREKPGRTGFAHLFEHIMFEGSGHVPEGDFDNLLEAAGGDNNGSTNNDRTNYFENVPSNALELALFLESDRMGYLLDAMSPVKVDGQRDVVKNERRQSYENRPYGMAWITLGENLYPVDHPYHWPVIGYMDDLTAASYEDVVDFFKKYYAPNNASLVIAGDIDIPQTRVLVEKWFADVKRGAPVAPPAIPSVYLDSEKRLILEDRVQLPRLYLAWLSAPSYTPGDAELDLLAHILAGGRNSRLYKRLVYDLQIAQDVSAFQDANRLSSAFMIIATARSGHALTELEKVIQEEINRLKNEAPDARELQRAVNQYEAAFLRQLESIEDKADQLNDYFMFTGNPDYFHEDLARYKALDPKDIQAVTQTYLRDDGRVVLSVVPQGKKELAAIKPAN